MFEAVIRPLPVKKKHLCWVLWVTAPNISAADRLNGARSCSEEVIFFLAAAVSQSSQFVAVSSAIVPTSPLLQINVRRWRLETLQRYICETFHGIQSAVEVQVAATPGTRPCFARRPQTILRG